MAIEKEKEGVDNIDEVFCLYNKINNYFKVIFYRGEKESCQRIPGSYKTKGGRKTLGGIKMVQQ